MGTPEHDLQHSPLSPIYDNDEQQEPPFVWGEQTKDYRRYKAFDMLENARKRLDGNLRDAKNYPISKGWYMEQAETMKKVILRIENYLKK